MSKALTSNQVANQVREVYGWALEGDAVRARAEAQKIADSHAALLAIRNTPDRVVLSLEGASETKRELAALLAQRWLTLTDETLQALVAVLEAREVPAPSKDELIDAKAREVAADYLNSTTGLAWFNSTVTTMGSNLYAQGIPIEGFPPVLRGTWQCLVDYEEAIERWISQDVAERGLRRCLQQDVVGKGEER